MSKNINHIGECFGCGICALICPHNIINITLNDKGFYQPKIVDKNRCIDCGACVSVCAYINEGKTDNEFAPTFYSGWHLDEEIRCKSSSGGVASALAGFAFENDYKFIGVRYNYDLDIAEHFIANNFEEQAQSLGSKYIQSYPSGVNRDINKTDKYVVFGTPCYIDSLRRFIQKKKIEKNFVLVDFFCHGVPSILLWNK